ncbi:MAG: hypothetical protein ACNA7K_03955 [Acholeplasmataceae bacterium]
METIYTFLETLFKDMPQTQAIKQAKDALYQEMVDQYLAYKEQGKTEHEAVGLVISECGSIDDVIKQLDIDRSGFNGRYRIISESEANLFMQVKRDNSTRIGLGVLFSVFAVGLLIILNDLLLIQYSGLTTFQAQLIVFIIFFIIISVSTGLFVFSGMQMNQKAKIFYKPFRLSNDAEKQMTQELKHYTTTYHLGLLIGILLIMTSIIAFVLNQLFEQDVAYLTFIGFIIIGMGIFVLVKIGIIHGGYSQLLKLGDYQPIRKEHSKITDMVAIILFSLSATIYLSWSFLFHAWTISWVIWPIVAIMFGIFASVMAYHDRKQNQ